jgi:hypothetical protein
MGLGVPFYLWFLVALCREGRRVRIGYWVRIRPAATEVAVIEPYCEKKRRARAA